MKVTYTNINQNLASNYWDTCLATLPAELYEKALKFRFSNDQQRFVLGKLLTIFSVDQLNIKLLSSLRYNPRGRPYFSSIKQDFNISHSMDYVVCAVTDDGRVGVDIEKIQQIDLTDFSRVMSKDQWSHIHASEKPLEEFFRYWTIKESLIKADGLGLAYPLQEIEIESDKASLGEDKWYFQEFSIDPHYKSCVSSNEPIGEVAILEVSLNELLQQ